MSSDSLKHAIVVEGLSKKYRLNHARQRSAAYRTLRESLAESFYRSVRRLQGVEPPAYSQEDFWALRDVSFSVERGERIAIIGRNGAGKSTLLKLLSRITEPTEGRIRVRGRMSSLLEVGTGFHPELTGRENIFLSGAVLGMPRDEIRRKFDAIVEFSEVETFLDTPVKRYSSGMYVKLAFAVSAFLDPDIIVLDEVLSVGDAAFQRKSQQKMLELAGQGRTVIFVSHSMAPVRSICDTGIVLQAGQASEKMEISQAVSAYLATSAPQEDLEFPYRTDELIVRSFRLLQHGDPATEFQGEVPIKVEIEFSALRPLPEFRMGIYINSGYGDRLVRSLLADWQTDMGNIPAGDFKLAGEIPENFLVEGRFTLELHCSRFGVRDYFADAITIPITIRRAAGYNALYPAEEAFGHVHLNANWRLMRE